MGLTSIQDFTGRDQVCSRKDAGETRVLRPSHQAVDRFARAAKATPIASGIGSAMAEGGAGSAMPVA